MSDEIAGAFIQVIGGAIAGYLIAWFTLRGQRQRQVLEIAHTSSASLLGFGEVSRSLLEVSVDKSRLTGAEADKGARENISSAYGHKIVLYNPGPETVGLSKVIIEFASEARILEHRFQPSNSDDFEIKGDIPKGNPNWLNVTIPYLNVEDTLQISVLTTGDGDEGIGKVRSNSKGLYVERRGLLNELGITAMNLTIIIILLTAVAFSGVRQILTDWFPGEYLTELGAKREQKLVWSWPVWYDFLAYIAGILLFIYVMWKMAKLDSREEKI